jgi:lipopolysaccharide export system protein LptA
MRTAWKVVLTLGVCFAPALARTRAQTPASTGTRSGGAVQTYHYKDTTNGKVVDAIFTGINSVSLPGGGVQVNRWKMTGIRDGQVTNVAVIAEAPECRIDYSRKFVCDPGPIQIYTPATNLFAEGTGFFCAESNQVLLLSNQVETRVLKSMLRSPLFQPASNAPADTGQIVKVLSGRGQFDFRSNVMDYAEQVRLIDPQYELDAPLLSIQFASNLTVETMFARTGVTLTMPGKGAAAGATAHYFGANENALLELAGDADAPAQWHNGAQEARAAKFTYDPNRHLLIGRDQARVRWPNPPNADPPAFFELFAGEAAMQMTPDGAEVESMTADGNVIIANQADHSSALAGNAAYSRARDLLTLTGDPVWWNDVMEVRGDTLSMASSNKVYHAQGNARLKIRVSGASGGSSGSTNQWLYVSADDAVSQPLNALTNLVTFRGDVRARLLDGEQLQDTLNSKELLVYLASNGEGPGNQTILVVARGEVRAETAPDAAGIIRTISCGVLTARRSPATGLWQSIVGEEDAVLESFGAGAGAVSNHLTAAVVKAFFSSVTNRIESAAAEGGAVFDQTVPGKGGAGGGAVSNHLTAAAITARFSSVTNQIESAGAAGGVVFVQTAPGKSLHATGEQAVYAVAPEEQVVLTGHPRAQTDKLTVLDADRLKYEVRSGAVEAFGRYHIVPNRTNAASAAPTPHPSI